MTVMTQKTIPVFVSILFLVVVGTVRAETLEKKPPNFLLMIADDFTYRDIGCYGSPNAKTPYIDTFASQGMQFSHCYTAIAMCVPLRNSLYTGLFPVRTGSYRNHSDCKPGTVSMVPYFRQLGYRVGLAGKVHVGPPESFPFESISGLTENCVSTKDDYSFAGIEEFMTRDADQPFFLIAAFIQPHVPWTVGDPSPFDPNELELPPHWADTRETRVSYAKYLAEVTFLDNQIGELLAIVDHHGLRDNTVVVFLSEQGAQFPGAKWTCWEQGLHAGALIRWPGKIKPASHSDALVQYVDFLPTFLEIARSSGAVSSGARQYDLDHLNLDGWSFLKVLEGETNNHGKYAYGIHNNIPEGNAYPIRSVRTKQFAFIRNLTPDKSYVVRFVQQDPNQPYYPSWRKAANEGDIHAEDALRRNEIRPGEELYDLTKDPWEMNNLAGQFEYAEILQELRNALDEWMQQQGDPGESLDVPIQQKSP